MGANGKAATQYRDGDVPSEVAEYVPPTQDEIRTAMSRELHQRIQKSLKAQLPILAGDAISAAAIGVREEVEDWLGDMFGPR